MNQSAEQLFQNICDQFQKGHCLVRYPEDEIVSFDQLNDGKPKKFQEAEELLNEAANYLLYKWCQDHNDPRFSKLLKVITVPIVEPDLTNVAFDDILELLSPATLETRTK